MLGAVHDGQLVSTVTLLLDCPPNQPHRGEIAKMMTRLSHRGRGIGTALLRAAEDLAARHHRSLLVLDTAVHGQKHVEASLSQTEQLAVADTCPTLLCHRRNVLPGNIVLQQPRRRSFLQAAI